MIILITWLLRKKLNMELQKKIWLFISMNSIFMILELHRKNVGHVKIKVKENVQSINLN